ncbi:hypothetical protein EVAR_89534_1 [Eumeta japonica]|uniref:Uncharacterized protein n=1 Tax=Eumeta variegata TaxID=151549 RepID=A0A4C1Y9H5_EUMVA|nr:hypothetical protein EVAR_89534_1 [Eumeta japonica]
MVTSKRAGHSPPSMALGRDLMDQKHENPYWLGNEKNHLYGRGSCKCSTGTSTLYGVPNRYQVSASDLLKPSLFFAKFQRPSLSFFGLLKGEPCLLVEHTGPCKNTPLNSLRWLDPGRGLLHQCVDNLIHQFTHGEDLTRDLVVQWESYEPTNPPPLQTGDALSHVLVHEFMSIYYALAGWSGNRDRRNERTKRKREKEKGDGMLKMELHSQSIEVFWMKKHQEHSELVRDTLKHYNFTQGHRVVELLKWHIRPFRTATRSHNLARERYRLRRFGNVPRARKKKVGPYKIQAHTLPLVSLTLEVFPSGRE